MPKAIQKILDALYTAEQSCIGTELVTPWIGQQEVLVRIAGIICRLQVENAPSRFRGYVVLQMESTARAAFVRVATDEEKRLLLDFLPSIRVVLVEPKRMGKWIAFPAHSGQQAQKLEGALPIYFVPESSSLFDEALVRFDGVNFFYDSPSGEDSNQAYRARVLRELLQARRRPDEVKVTGMTPEEKLAYKDAYEQPTRKVARSIQKEGGNFLGAESVDDLFVVRYEINNVAYKSIIRKSDLAVMTAGVCLRTSPDGYDIGSLVKAIRECPPIQRTYWRERFYE